MNGSPESRARILLLLREKMQSAKEVSRHLDLDPITIRAYLHQLKKAGRIRIGDWNGNTKIYAYGGGEDAPNTRARILIALQGTEQVKLGNGWVRTVPKRMTIAMLHEALDTTGADVARLVKAMIKDGKLYLSDWQQVHYNQTPMYSLGHQKAKRRPKPLTWQELRRRQRDAIKADPIRFMKLKAQEQARTIRRRKHAKPDPILSQFAGLFGERRAA